MARYAVGNPRYQLMNSNGLSLRRFVCDVYAHGQEKAKSSWRQEFQVEIRIDYPISIFSEYLIFAMRIYIYSP